jgi:hypothetical protein
MNKLVFALIFFIFYGLSIKNNFAQCIVINEIMVNATAANSDGTGPNAGEWTELYNSCNTPIDISCWAFGDAQEFIAFIPPGTIIPPGGFYMIGSSNSAVPVDLNLGSCNCVYTQVTVPPGINIGVFTNGNEQAVLLDDLGNYVDGVIWGGGQTPMNISGSDPSANCGSAAFNLNGINDFTSNNQLPGQGNNAVSDGCTMSRICDGSSTWVQTCAPNITPGASNGTPPQISFSNLGQTLCQGECINIYPNITGQYNSILWNFVGSNTPNITSDWAENICYQNIGNYDINVTLNYSCGNVQSIFDNYITVIPHQNPIINLDSIINICSGDSILLETNNNFSNYQWYINESQIINANQSTFFASNIGLYQVNTFDANGCSGFSNIIEIQNGASIINEPNNQSINIGENAQFNISAAGNNLIYQWQKLVNGDYQNLVDNTTYQGTQSNLLLLITPNVNLTNSQYRCIISDGLCSDTSEFVVLIVNSTVNIRDNIISKKNINIAPNPAESYFYITLKEECSNCILEINSIEGKIATTEKIKSKNQKINIESIKPGIYFLKISNQDSFESFSSKLIIK